MTMMHKPAIASRPYTTRRIKPQEAADLGSKAWAEFNKRGPYVPEPIFGAKGGGKKKGGGPSATTATITPDTLATRSIARGIDAISEGPYGGLINPGGEESDRRGESIFLDDTPLQNTGDGKANFNGVTYTEVLGTADQDYMPGFTEVESEVVVNAEAKFDSPVTRTITDPDIDAAMVKVRIPQLTLISDNGSIRTHEVEYAIDRQDNGGSFVEVARDKMKEKFGSPAEFQYRIPLTPGGNPWTLRLRRLSADDSDQKHQSATFFSSYTKIIDSKLAYPFTGAVGWTISAEEFGADIPSRAFEVIGAEIEVPTNYDPVAKTYATEGPGTSGGLWDGTFKTEPTENPAWWLRHLLIEPRYGCGLDAALVDKWSLYRIAQYCDELVPDGKGGMEPRYRFNYWINTQVEAYTLLQSIVSVFRGMLYWGGGTIVATADMPADPIRNIVRTNIISNSLNYEGAADDARHTVALVTWNDPEDGFRPAVCVVVNQELLNERGWIPIDVLAYGCNSEGQAHRMGAWLLDTEATATEVASWTASFDQADLAPGDVVNLLDPDYAGVPYGGNLVAAAVDSVTLDRPVAISSADEATICVVLKDNRPSEYRAIAETGPAVTVIAIDPPFDEAPVQNARWIISSGVAAPRQFRVITAGETEKNKFPFSALFHDPLKYDRVEQGFNLEPQPYSAIPTGPILTPKELKYSEYLYEAGPSLLTAVTVSWSAPADPRIMFYEFQASPPGEVGYTRTGKVATTRVDLDNISPGSLRVLVRASDGIGRKSAWVAYEATVFGLQNPPAAPTGFGVTILGDQATFNWDASLELDVKNGAGYAWMKYAPTTEIDGATWETSADLFPHIDGTSIQAPALSGTFFLKWVDSSGVQSTTAAVLISTIGGLLDLDVTEELIEDPDFPGAKDRVVVNAAGPYLMLGYGRDIFADADWFAPPDWFYGTEGLYTEGYYYFAETVDLTDVFRSRIIAAISAGTINVLADWFGQADVFAGADWFLGGPGDWTLRIEIRTTNDDPNSSGVVWSDWAPFITGDYLARAFQFRLYMATPDPAVSPAVLGLSISVNMPDRIIAENDLVCPAAGMRYDFTPAFKSFKGIGFGESDLASGDRRDVWNKSELGFNIRFYNSVGTGVERVFDFVAKGYGKVST